MLSRRWIALVVAGAVVFLAGCGQEVKEGHVAVISEHDRECDHSSASDRALAIQSMYIGHGGAHIVGASLHDGCRGLTLTGRLTVDSPATTSASKFIRVEGVTANEELLWSALTKLESERSGNRYRVRSGTFTVEVPGLAGVDHFHISLVAGGSKDKPLSHEIPQEKNS